MSTPIQTTVSDLTDMVSELDTRVQQLESSQQGLIGGSSGEDVR
jgi:hypothetical protein